MWLLILALCAVHVWSIERGPRWLFYATKTLPILLMAIVSISLFEVVGQYALWMAVGLLVSVVGDLLLMHPKDRFVQGLTVFLLVHFIYSFAFYTQLDGLINWWLPLLLLSIGIIVFLLLLPTLGNMKLPVAFYSLGILGMAWAAIEYWRVDHAQSAAFAVMGALIFITSDIVLAVDRFRSSSAFSRHVIMITYYTAQLLLTLSVVAYRA
ncbi:lysoplasmalogenase [Vibrio sp. St2]|uniref:lysoplasmalogenase n=1 Tax=Vibrio sp. St2 TaxID=2853441 RepID=UPI00248EC015|nr:lysoplasmalogenase [Vibrio sp. St2]